MSEPAAAPVHCTLIVLRVGVARLIDYSVAAALRDELLRLYTEAGATHALVDMGAVTYLSSVGISPLLGLLQAVRQREGRMALCALQRDVEDVFHATRLIGPGPGVAATFEHHPDVPSAVRHLYPPDSSEVAI